jgi:hypothetical protein
VSLALVELADWLIPERLKDLLSPPARQGLGGLAWDEASRLGASPQTAKLLAAAEPALFVV